MMWRFLRYYRPYKWLFLLDMFCALAVSAIDLAFPQILNLLTKGLFTRPAAEIIRVIWYVGAGLFALYLLRYGCQYFITSWGHIMGARMESDMREDLFDHYHKLSFSYYDRNNTGEMMSKLVSDLFDITELAHHGPETLLISILKITGAFAILLTIHVPMTLILLAVTIGMAVFSLTQNRKMRRIFLDNRQKIAKVNARIQDSLAGIRVVKSFANEEIERGKFGDSNQAFLNSKTESYKIMGIFHAGNSFFQGLLYIAILVSGGLFVADGTLKAAELAIYALYVGIFLQPVEMLVNFTEQFQRGWSGFRRFSEVLGTMPAITDRHGARELGTVQGEITYDQVSFAYETGPEVLHNISFQIPAGQTVALVGPSGGGKSTICSLLPRFYDVTAGAIRIDGIDVRDCKLKSLRSKIGIVQQDVYMFQGTIRDNICYGKPDASDEEIVAAARRANIHEDILGFPDGYATEVGERGVRLSGGQKQRIAIARVFLRNPPVLILDEATSALDNESERHIQSALAALSRGRTTLVIAHRLSTIRHADRIIAIDNGRIAEAGTHAELLRRNGIYAHYYNMQFDFDGQPERQAN